MDFNTSDRTVSDFSDADLSDLMDNEMDMFDPTQPADMAQYSMDNDWLDKFFEDDPVLNDKMMSEALQPPQVRSDHSYSRDEGCESPLNLCKADNKGELDLEFLTTAVPQIPCTQVAPQVSQPNMSAARVPGQSLLIKREPGNVATSASTNLQPEQLTSSVTVPTQMTNVSMSQPVMKQQPTIILTTQSPVQQPMVKQERLVLPKVNIKVEPEEELTVNYDALGLPPTPPSSNTSDSEGSLSPQRSAPSSPIRHSPYTRQHSPTAAAVRSITAEPLFTSPIPQSGVLILTEEEKRTLITEGYPIPQKLPLSKQEEKNLKKIRRKIKNKISAQESRRKKKEYLETLERRVESFNQENCDLKKKVEHLETNNRSLLSQLQKLQALVGKLRPTSPSSTSTGTCLMVLVMCFAIFLGGWSPTSLNIGYTNRLAAPVKSQPIGGPHMSAMGPEVQDPTVDAYTTPNVRSRLLMSVKEEPGEEEQYGPHTPFSYQNIFINLFSSSNPSEDSTSLEMEPPMPRVMTQQEDVRVNHSEVKVNQAIMHPDISADVNTNVVAVDNRLNATA